MGGVLRAITGIDRSHGNGSPTRILFSLANYPLAHNRGRRYYMARRSWQTSQRSYQALDIFDIIHRRPSLGGLDRPRALSPESSLVLPSKTGGTLPVNPPGHVLRRAGIPSTVYGCQTRARRLPSFHRTPEKRRDHAGGGQDRAVGGGHLVSFERSLLALARIDEDADPRAFLQCRLWTGATPHTGSGRVKRETALRPNRASMRGVTPA